MNLARPHEFKDVDQISESATVQKLEGSKADFWISIQNPSCGMFMDLAWPHKSKTIGQISVSKVVQKLEGSKAKDLRQNRRWWRTRRRMRCAHKQLRADDRRRRVVKRRIEDSLVVW